MLGGHSGLDPPLPISNRAVKRTSANDSMLFACESRSLPSYLYRDLTITLSRYTKAPSMRIAGAFCCAGVAMMRCNREGSLRFLKNGCGHLIGLVKLLWLHKNHSSSLVIKRFAFTIHMQNN